MPVNAFCLQPRKSSSSISAKCQMSAQTVSADTTCKLDEEFARLWKPDGSTDVCSDDYSAEYNALRDGFTAHVTCSHKIVKRGRDDDPPKTVDFKTQFCASVKTLGDASISAKNDKKIRNKVLDMYNGRLHNELSDQSWDKIMNLYKEYKKKFPKEFSTDSSNVVFKEPLLTRAVWRSISHMYNNEHAGAVNSLFAQHPDQNLSWEYLEQVHGLRRPSEQRVLFEMQQRARLQPNGFTWTLQLIWTSIQNASSIPNAPEFFNLKDSNGDTALTRAIYSNHHIVARKLVEQEVSIGLNINEPPALIIACSLGYEHVVDELLKSQNIEINLQTKNEKMDALMIASRDGHITIVTKLVTIPGLEMGRFSRSGMTALMLASAHGHAAVVRELLIRLGKHEVNAQDPRSGRMTALMLASSNGHVAVVSELLQFDGIGVNMQNASGQTAFDLARNRQLYRVQSEMLKWAQAQYL